MMEKVKRSNSARRHTGSHTSKIFFKKTNFRKNTFLSPKNEKDLQRKFHQTPSSLYQPEMTQFSKPQPPDILSKQTQKVKRISNFNFCHIQILKLFYTFFSFFLLVFFLELNSCKWVSRTFSSFFLVCFLYVHQMLYSYTYI